MQKFTFITHDNHDAYFNLASEEYLLKQKGGYYIYLWINAPAVIVGVNQNVLQEVNLAYTEKQGIKVVRRLTGGGAVYHDKGNICYTFIAPYDSAENAYRRFTAPVIEYLRSIGVNAEFSGRNDICVDGKKISGNAQVVYNGKIMHHGTILFDTDPDALSNSLIQNKLKIESKGIKSIRARVANIKNLLPSDMTVEEFYDGLCVYLSKDCEKYSFTAEDISAIDKLVAEKYSRYDWNVGYSPKGNNRFDARFPFGTMTFTFDLKEGLIENAAINGDFFAVKDLKPLADDLNGVKYSRTDMERALKNIGDYIKGASAKEVADAMFKE